MAKLIISVRSIRHSTKQSLKTVDRLSAVDEEADGISVVIRYESQGCEKADDCITNEYMSDEQTKKDGDIHEIDYTMIKYDISFNFLPYFLILNHPLTQIFHEVKIQHFIAFGILFPFQFADSS